MASEPDPRLSLLGRLVGTWATEATHPAMPGVVVHGSTVVSWLEGGRFLRLDSRMDHPDFPDALAVIGDMGRDRDAGANAAVPTDAGTPPLRMHYFDSRGVFRAYETRIDATAWRWWRDAPGFSQRFTGLISADGHTIEGHAQLCEDDVHWKDDLQIRYRRRG